MQRVAIIIPIYKEEMTKGELISLQQCFTILGNYQIIFVCPKNLEFGTIHTSNKGKAQFVFLEVQHFESITTYNHLLLSVWFYELFSNYKYILIHQLDSFVFKDELINWIEKGYSYVGAPWFENDSDKFMGVGNGGFSLRNVNDCISVLKNNKKVHSLKSWITRNKQSKKSLYWLRGMKHYFMSDTFKSIHKNKIVNEDKTFALAGKRFNFFKIPNPEIALKFAFEKQPSRLFKMNNNQLPFGCHAWWTYDLKFFTPFIEEFGYLINDLNE